MANYSKLLPATRSQSGNLDWHPEVEGPHHSHNANSVVHNLAQQSSDTSSTLSSTPTACHPPSAATAATKRSSVDRLTSLRDSPSSWTLEIIAVIISTGAIISIVALLYRENGRPISGWKLAVTLNTVIAALGTLARTTLAFALSACVGQQRWNWLRRRPDSLIAWERFDEASRGPWGGARLLIWLRARHWATLGALVTVGAVAFDPFLQAVLSTRGQLDVTSTGATATIGQSLRIDGGRIQALNGAAVRDRATNLTYLASVTSRADFGFVSSVWNGFQNTSTFRNDAIGAECSTGNCTWPVFTSAAVCSSCEDVSRDIVRREFLGLNGSNIPSYPINDYNGSYVKFELPYANIRNYKGFLNRTNLRVNPTYMTANTTVHANRTIAFQKSETLLMAFLMMQAPKESLDGDIRWEDAAPVATECALYLCANSYEAKSENNLVTEHILDTWVQKVPGSYVASTEAEFYELDAAAAWIDSLGSTLYDARIDRTDLQLRIPYEESEHLPAHVQRKFNVSHAFVFSAIDYLLDWTKGQQLNPSVNIPKSDETWGMMSAPIYSASQSAIIDALWNSTNLTITFDDVARSITNQIRNSSPDRHQGELKHWVIHVQVDWAYLAYPLTMLVAGIIYVILTITESRRLKMPVWKESSMPTLLHGFDDETQTLLRSEDKASQRKVLVRFMDDENGCQRLVAQQ